MTKSFSVPCPFNQGNVLIRVLASLRARARHELHCAHTARPYEKRTVCRMELIAYFWEQDDAEAVAARLAGEVRRGRFHGEDDDEDHPWVVVLSATDLDEVDRVVAEYDGWLETAVDRAASPVTLPSQPKRFKR
jgi:hypothetical protein